MDFFDPKKKKAQKIRLYIGYCLMGIALLIGTLIVWYQTYGYDIDRHTGSVIQKGLIFVDAHPQSATIYLNGEDKGQTGSRFTPVAGHYSLELKRDGYRSWKHDFDLAGGTVEQFVYPLLFPANMQVSEKQAYTSRPAFVSSSPDRHWLLVQQPGSFTSFDLFDLTNSSAKPTTILLPADSITSSKAQQHLEAVEWASDNRHLLIKHVFGTESEFMMLDRESPSDSLNLNKIFGASPSDVTLRDKKPDQFFFFLSDGGVLQTVDLKSKITLPFLSRIIAYKSRGSGTVLYVTDAGAPAGKVLVRVHDGDKDYTLKELPTGTTYLLGLTEFGGHWYMATGATSEGKVSIYRDPVAILRKSSLISAKPISTLRLDQPSTVSFSTNSRFVMAQSGSSFAVYDAEKDKQLHYDTKLANLQSINATWMDGHRLAVVNNSTVTVFDFDGTNMQTLSPADPNYQVFFDRDYQAMYALAPVKVSGQTALTRTELVVK